ncbi:MAG: hypothetical protein R2932_01725 [Caldilineaceae bacterium]
MYDLSLFDSYEAVYPNAEELSGFFATLAVVRDIGVVIFAGLIAGRLLRRFGIVWGFTLNAMAVGALSLIILLFGWINSFAPQQFFGLTVAAYLLELMFLNGLLSTATRTAYQVLAPNERTKIIAAIDGIGVPMAYGLAALLAITLKQVVGFSIHSIVLLLITVIGMQLVVGLWLRYAYAKRLRHVIQHRSTFDPYLDSSTGMRTATEMVAAMSGNREQIPPTALQDWTVSTQSQKEDCDGTVAQIINQFYQLLQQFGSASVYSTNVQEQLRQLHQQLFSLLGTVYGKELMDNAAQDLLYGNRQQQSLVLEMLEMTFSKEHRRTLLPLLDPHITNASRIMHLQKTTRS